MTEQTVCIGGCEAGVIIGGLAQGGGRCPMCNGSGFMPPTMAEQTATERMREWLATLGNNECPDGRCVDGIEICICADICPCGLDAARDAFEEVARSLERETIDSELQRECVIEYVGELRELRTTLAARKPCCDLLECPTHGFYDEKET